MKFKFERIDNRHHRAKVHGGWILKEIVETNVFSQEGDAINRYDSVQNLFIPDPRHEWVIDDNF